MKKFQYRLKALLKMTEFVEKEKQKKLAVSTKKIKNQKNLLTQIEKSRNDTCNIQRKRTENAFSVAELIVISRYIHKLKGDKMMGKELLKVLNEEEKNKRAELLEATKEKKKYEKIKEHQKGKYHKNIESMLIKEIDEIAINSYRLKEKFKNKTSQKDN